MVPIFKRKGDIRNFGCYRTVKFLEHGMKVVERVFEKWLCRIVSVNEMQFGFMPERGTINAVFILRRMQGKYHARGKKLYMCFVDLEKVFDRVLREVFESFILGIASFNFSDQHHVLHSLLSLFLPHIFSHAHRTSSIQCPHKFAMPTSNNSITFS